MIGGRQERQEREAIKWSLKINISRSSSVYRERGGLVQNPYTDLNTRPVTCRPGPLALKAVCLYPLFFFFCRLHGKLLSVLDSLRAPAVSLLTMLKIFYFFLPFQTSTFRRPQRFTVQGEGLKCLWAHNNMWYRHDIK